LEKTTGADGKARPTRRKSNRQPLNAKTSSAQLSQIALSEFSKILHERPAETLEEVTRLLLRERAQIAELSLERRVELARGSLQALDVSPDQLSRPNV
jgi:hypothetical protein